jgi:hypothetical protein
MDIIAMGDFAVTNFNDKTTFSFRVPAAKEIDFIPEAEANNVRETGANRHDRRAMMKKMRGGR